MEINVKKAVFSLLTDLNTRLGAIILNTLIDLKSFIYSEDNYLRGHTMFLGLLHNQLLEFMRIVFSLLLTRNNSISNETLQLLSNAVTNNRQSGTQISRFLMEQLQAFKWVDESSTYFLLLNQFL